MGCSHEQDFDSVGQCQVRPRRQHDPRQHDGHEAHAGARLAKAVERFGVEAFDDVEPREWFLVPLPAIDEAIQRIKDGTIGEFRYDPQSAIFTY